MRADPFEIQLKVLINEQVEKDLLFLCAKRGWTKSTVVRYLIQREVVALKAMDTLELDTLIGNAIIDKR